MDALREELNFAVEDAMMGQPMNQHLAGRLQLAAFSVLHKHGLSHAKVRVSRQGAGMKVHIDMPPQVPTVRQIVLSVGR